MRTTLAIPLASRAGAALFLAIVAAPVSLFVAQTVRITLAQSWGGSGEEHKVQQAVALDPENPELHSQLGTVYLFDLAADPAPAIASLHKATELDPNRSEYWLGLARGCLVAGDHACARQAFERAVQAAPMRPGVEQEAASYYAVTGEQDKVLGHLRRVLELTRETPWLRGQVFQLSWRAVQDPALVWQTAIAPSQDAAVQCDYLDFLAENNRFDLTGQYWAATARSARGMSFAIVQPYLQRLLEAQQYEQASTVWQDLLGLGVVASAAGSAVREASSGNLVFNASFAQPILNAGFDWQRREQTYVALDFAGGNVGGHGLRVDFTVAHNSADEPLYQLVPVLPNQHYRLTAKTRSEAITSESGPRLRIVDVRSPSSLDLATEGTVGSTPRHEVELAFSTGPQTSFVRLSVWRPRSRSFPPDISGSVWFDDISLRPAQAGKAQPASGLVAASH